MTARMRWRSFRAVDGLSCQIGARIPTTLTLVTSEIGNLPDATDWRSKLPRQSCGRAGATDLPRQVWRCKLAEVTRCPFVPQNGPV